MSTHYLCPHCREPVRYSATICPHCHQDPHDREPNEWVEGMSDNPLAALTGFVVFGFVFWLVFKLVFWLIA